MPTVGLWTPHCSGQTVVTEPEQFAVVPSDGTVTVAKLAQAFILPVARGGTGATTLAGLKSALGFGTAATADVGTLVGNVVQVQTGGKLPALDGSALTGIVGATGATGATGPQGPQGIPGATGANGIPGANGTGSGTVTSISVTAPISISGTPTVSPTIGISAVTTSAAGSMSAEDKVKLDGVAISANNYSHPATHAPSIIAQDASNRFVTDTEKTAWGAKQTALGLGTSLQVLRTNGVANALEWASVSTGGGDVYLAAANTFTGRNVINLGTDYSGIESTLSRLKVNSTTAAGMNWAILGVAQDTAGVNANGNTTVGVTGIGMTVNGNSRVWGAYGEAWSGTLTTKPSSAPIRLTNEFAVISQYHNNPDSVEVFGIDVLFKNRQDNYSSVIHGIGSNKFNNNSKAVRIWAQSSSSAGEQCGWNDGIYFAATSLQSCYRDNGSLRRATAINMSNIHIGDTDCLRFPDGSVQNTAATSTSSLFATTAYASLAPIVVRLASNAPALISTYGTTGSIANFLEGINSDGYFEAKPAGALTSDSAIKVSLNGTQYWIPIYRV